jgi:hypothetical protein
LTLPKDRLVGDAVTLPAGSPVPEREMCWGLLESLSVKVSVAVRAPVAVGLKETATVQLEEAASAEPHVFWEIKKSPGFVPVRPMLLIVTALVPLLVRVADCCAPELPTATDGQVIEVGSAVTEGPGLTPLPDKEAESGVELLLLVMVKTAERAPAAVGEKTTDSVHDAEAASVDWQVVDGTEKSPGFVPEIDAAARLMEPDVVFDIEIDCRPLVAPMLAFPNERLVGDIVTDPVGAIMPVPETATCCGLSPASSV